MCPIPSGRNVRVIREYPPRSRATASRTASGVEVVSATVDEMEKVEVESLLELVRAAVREELKALGAPKQQPKAVSYKDACVLLGVKPTKLKQMVARGVLLTAQYDGDSRPRIPMMEIERLVTPKSPVGSFSAGTKPSRQTRRASLRQFSADAEIKRLKRR